MIWLRVRDDCSSFSSLWRRSSLELILFSMSSESVRTSPCFFPVRRLLVGEPLSLDVARRAQNPFNGYFHAVPPVRPRHRRRRSMGRKPAVSVPARYFFVKY